MIVTLAEIDMGGFAEFLNKLVDSVREHVATKLAAALGAAAGFASGGPVGALIGMVVGYVVGKAIEWLKAWWSDDVFAPVTLMAVPLLSRCFWSRAACSSRHACSRYITLGKALGTNTTSAP